jgi:hypothetical protein
MVGKDHTELGPLYYDRPLPEGEGTEAALLWPFFQRYSSPAVQQFAFRPFLNWRHQQTSGLNGKVFEVQALWPLFHYRTTEGVNRLRIRLYPIFWHRRFHHPEGDEVVDTALLPLLLTGNSERRGRYFALFPLGGELKGFFAQDRIRFFLFPLFAEAWQGEHRSWHVLWPFFQYSKGGGKSSLRIFPFYIRKEKENWYRKMSILWPFFARSQEWLGTDHPTDSWFFLPFYARQQTPFGKISYYLYPLFSFQRNERPGNRFRAWTAPWPLYEEMRGDRYWKTYFWPFWGRFSIEDTYEKEIAAYPVYWFYSFRTRSWVMTSRYVLPFYWDRRDTDPAGTALRKRVKVWPFLELADNMEGKSYLNVLSPLWFRDPNGMERNYGDFWTLYRSELTAGGDEIRRILWYRWNAGPLAAEAGGQTPAGARAEKPALTGEPASAPAAEMPVTPEGSGSGARVKTAITPGEPGSESVTEMSVTPEGSGSGARAGTVGTPENPEADQAGPGPLRDSLIRSSSTPEPPASLPGSPSEDLLHAVPWEKSLLEPLTEPEESAP